MRQHVALRPARAAAWAGGGGHTPGGTSPPAPGTPPSWRAAPPAGSEPPPAAPGCGPGGCGSAPGTALGGGGEGDAWTLAFPWSIPCHEFFLSLWWGLTCSQRPRVRACAWVCTPACVWVSEWVCNYTYMFRYFRYTHKCILGEIQHMDPHAQT